MAQSIMGIASDERFVKTAARRLGHLFPSLTNRSGFDSAATDWPTRSSR